MAQQIVDVVLHLQKSTGGTHVYGEKTSGEPPKIKSLYVPKWVFPEGDGPPDSLHMTLEIP